MDGAYHYQHDVKPADSLHSNWQSAKEISYIKMGWKKEQ